MIYTVDLGYKVTYCHWEMDLYGTVMTHVVTSLIESTVCYDQDYLLGIF